MIREDRQLLAELARLNSDTAPFTMRIMDSASATDQARYAQRLITAGELLQRRTKEANGVVIEGDVSLPNSPLILPGLTVEPHREL